MANNLTGLPKPTAQGAAIIAEWTSTSQSLMINAYAGTGKTTTLRQLAPYIKEPRVLCLAFNKKNAEDLEKVMPERFTCSTLNSQGHRALQRASAKKLSLDAAKNSKIISKLAEDWGAGRLPEDEFNGFSSILRHAKSGGLMHSAFPNFKSIVPDEPEFWEQYFDQAQMDWTQDGLRFARETLRLNIELAIKESLIDYDDQIYISTLAIGAYEKFPVVMVDEAQDLSVLNHWQIKKTLALGGRYIVVGDPKQAIYAFRGASSKSMAQIKNLLPEGRFTELPLSLTFRCPQLVVARSLSHAPGFEAHESCVEGNLYDLRNTEWNLDTLPREGKVAILSRNNAPLLSAAFKLIRSGVGVTMLGRDIGKSLIRVLHKVAGEKKDLPVLKIVEKTTEWMEREIALARANKKEDKVALIEDQAECLLAVAEGSGAHTLAQVEDAILRLFENQSGLVVLGTGHRAKGMEWETVVHLDPWRLPSKQAIRAEANGDDGPLEQENNLLYVIETRSKNNLVLANLEEYSATAPDFKYLAPVPLQLAAPTSVDWLTVEDLDMDDFI